MSSPSSTIQPPTADELFEDWLSTRANNPQAPLDPNNALPYRYIWGFWCDWLSEQHGNAANKQGYLQASSDDVRRFLRNGPTPSSQRRASTSLSPVTAYRYGSLLQHVYSHAVCYGWMERNPVHEGNLPDCPDDQENSGAILPPGTLELLPTLPTDDASPWEIRNHAIILLLHDTGMTSGELRNLRQQNLQLDKEPAGIHIKGTRAAQDRFLPISQACVTVLQRWLRFVREIGHAQDWVFPTERVPQMTRRALFKVVADKIVTVCSHQGHALPYHIGPNIVRNSVLVRWLRQGQDEATVALWAGHKDTASLRHLRIHLL